MINSNQLSIKEPPSPYAVGEVDLSILQSEQSGFDSLPIMKQFPQQKIIDQEQYNKTNVQSLNEGDEKIEQQQVITYPKPQEFIKIPYDKLKFIQQPIQKEGILQCHVRKINNNKSNQKYELVIFDYPILIAEKINTMFKRKFVIRLIDPNMLAGKIKWDKQGLNFIFIDNKFNPKKCSSSDLHRNCLGGANYNKQGKKKPHKIQVFLPEVQENNEIKEYKDIRFFEKLPEGFIEFKNRDPIYTKETNTYTLFYYNRALLASSKNFQLCRANSSQIQLLFGKIEKGLYNLDFTWPISPLQAFQIALSCYISKARD